jgi:photosynthetic reaction center H subunit
MTVYGGDGAVAGTVKDLWIDRSEPIFRYVEIETPTAGGARNVLVPILCCRITFDDVKVKALYAKQFANIPATRNPDSITFLEEDKISAYCAGGMLYADPSRQEPLL